MRPRSMALRASSGERLRGGLPRGRAPAYAGDKKIVRNRYPPMSRTGLRLRPSGNARGSPGRKRRRPTMTTTITTFLTYDNQAEEAARLYTSLFGGKITQTTRYPVNGPKPEGAVMTVT